MARTAFGRAGHDNGMLLAYDLTRRSLAALTAQPRPVGLMAPYLKYVAYS